MYVYLLFILFGIMIFLLLNKYNTFSIGNQFSLYNKPCTCSDEFNMPFQTSDECLYIDGRNEDDEFAISGQQARRREGRYGMPCEWSGNSDLITRMQVHTTLRNFYLNDTAERFTQCRAQYRSGHDMCALVNGIEYYCYLIGVPVNESDIDYMVELNIGSENDRSFIQGITGNLQYPKLSESICKIFLKSEGISILKRDKLIPDLKYNLDFTKLLENKYYYCSWGYTSNIFTRIGNGNHSLTIYYFMEDGIHKIVILDSMDSWAESFLAYGLQNTILEMDDLNIAPMRIMAFYLKFRTFLVLSNNIIFMRDRVTLLDGTEILCKVISFNEISVTSESSLESRELLTLARDAKFKVIERLDLANDARTIRMRVISYLDNDTGEWRDLPGSGWVTLTDNTENFNFIPDDYFTNLDYDREIIQLVNSNAYFREFLTCAQIFDDGSEPINGSYMDSEYFRLVQPLQSNPLFQINDEVIFKIHENYLYISAEFRDGYIKVYFGDFALSSFRCDSFTLSGSELAPDIEDNHIVMRIYRYTHITLASGLAELTKLRNNLDFYYDPITLHFNVPNTTIDLLKVQKM